MPTKVGKSEQAARRDCLRLYNRQQVKRRHTSVILSEAKNPNTLRRDNHPNGTSH